MRLERVLGLVAGISRRYGRISPSTKQYVFASKGEILAEKIEEKEKERILGSESKRERGKSDRRLRLLGEYEGALKCCSKNQALAMVIEGGKHHCLFRLSDHK